MYRLRLTLLLIFLALASASAQDAEPESNAQAEADAGDQESPGAEDVTDEEIEELLGIDEDYTELEDDFDPTEEVRFEQSIPFPTDI